MPKESLAPWSYEPAARRPRKFTGSPVSSEDECERRNQPEWTEQDYLDAQAGDSSPDEVGSPEI